jgi:LPXTG-motif cell wall-anchored protein
MYPTPTRTGAAGALATTGLALQNWILAALGLVLLGVTVLFLTRKRETR